MKLIVISGRSGSGKSICLHVLEDLGFYCIDNLPIGLLPALVQEVSSEYKQIAISIDARNLPANISRFESILTALKKSTHNYEVIYLDADDSTLLKRFSETRRKHPLSSNEVSLKEALQQESLLLQPIAELADLRIDTSCLTMHQLRDLLHKRLVGHPGKLSLLFESFGYKFGVPGDADFVFDVRCLPNPYWQTALSTRNGLDPEVIKYLDDLPEAQRLLQDIQAFLEKWIPEFIADNRNYLTVAIGCTGGQHRSVYCAEKLAAHFKNIYSNIQTRHRDMRD